MRELPNPEKVDPPQRLPLLLLVRNSAQDLWRFVPPEEWCHVPDAGHPCGDPVVEVLRTKDGPRSSMDFMI